MALNEAEKRDILFGPQFREPIMQPEDGYNVENRIRPAEWVGKNQHINRILIRKIESADDFIIRTLLPIQKIPAGGKIRVSHLIFNDQTLDDIPEMGTARLTTQSYRTFETSVKRKGLGFIMEDGFLMTPMGLESYRHSIMQISNATTLTMIMEAYYALLMSVNTETYYRAMGLIHANPSYSDIFLYEIRLWSILSKTKSGFWTMSNMGRESLVARQKRPDSLILPSGARNYLKFSRPEDRSYSEMGPAGPAAFLGKGYIHQFAGLDIFESTMLPMPDTEQTEDPLVRPRSIGEFGDSIVEDNDDCEPMQYRTSLRNRIIHDNRTDNWYTLKFDTMMHHSGLFSRVENDEKGAPDNSNDELPSEDVGQPFFSGYRNVGEWLKKFKYDTKIIRAIAAKMRDVTTTKNVTAEWSNLLKRLGINSAITAESSANDVKYADGFAGRDATITNTQGKRDRMGVNRFMDGDSKEDSDDDAMMTSSSAAAPAKSVTFTYYMVDPKIHLTDIPPTVTLDSLSMGQGPYASIFDRYKKSDSNPMARRLTKIDLQKFMEDIEREYSKGNSAEIIRGLPWIQMLRIMYSSRDQQSALYDMFASDTKKAEEFLYTLYGGTSIPGTRTTGGAFHSRTDQKNVLSVINSKTRGAPAQTAELKERLQAKFNMYRSRFPQMDQVVPSFLSGSLITYMSSGLSLEEAEVKVASLMNIVKAIQPEITEIYKRGEATRFDARNPTQRLIRLLQQVQTAAELDELIAFWTPAVEAAYITNDSVTFIAAVETARNSINALTAAQNPRPKTQPGTTESDAIEKALFLMPISAKFFRFLSDNDIPVPINFTFARPNMCYEMGSAIMMVRGQNTGACLFGEPDFQMSNEGNRKVLFGFFTCYAGCVIYEAENVQVLHNVTCKRYLGGGGCTFFDPLDQEDRSMFASGKATKDMFIIPMMPGEKVTENQFDLCGMYPEDVDTNSNTGQRRHHYLAHFILTALWGFHPREYYFDIEYYRKNAQHLNTLCFRMHQFVPMLVNGTVNPTARVVLGRGHWGSDVYAGVREDRVGMGSYGYVRKCNWDGSASNSATL